MQLCWLNMAGCIMTRRFNFRVPDHLANQVDSIAREVNASGEHVSISEIARKLIEEGLHRMSAKTPATGDKGTQFEKYVESELKAALWDADVQRPKKKSGQRNADVRAPMFDFECKTGKRPSTREAFAQAKAQCMKGQTPVAVIKDEDAEPFVVMTFHTFLALYRAVYELAVFAEELPQRLNDVE